MHTIPNIKVNKNIPFYYTNLGNIIIRSRSTKKSDAYRIFQFNSFYVIYYLPNIIFYSYCYKSSIGNDR